MSPTSLLEPISFVNKVNKKVFQQKQLKTFLDASSSFSTSSNFSDSFSSLSERGDSLLSEELSSFLLSLSSFSSSPEPLQTKSSKKFNEKKGKEEGEIEVEIEGKKGNREEKEEKKGGEAKKV